MANKIFFPPIGTNTFADNLVGVQITDAGGLTQGNFQFTTAIYEKTNRSFDTGVFSDAYTLDNLKVGNLQEAKRIIEKNFKVYPNYDLSEITSFSLYGSLAKRLSASAIKIINNFPAAIEVIAVHQSGLLTGQTAYNISYSSLNDETTFSIDSVFFRNPFEIDFSENAERNIEVRPYPIHPIRALTSKYESYALYFDKLDVEYPLTDFEPTVSVSGGTVTMTVSGNPFSGATASTRSLIIKPNNTKTQEIFTDAFDEVEKFLLNRNSAPLYTAKFSYPDYDSNGVSTLYNTSVTWPINKFWNLDITSSLFNRYLDDLQMAAEKLDEYKTNLISRFLITGSFKEFDTTDQKVEKVLQLYGRSFDEVKKFIDSLAYINSVNYQVGNDIPSQLLFNLAQTLGINPNISPITKESFLDTVFSTKSQQIFEGQKNALTPTELNYQYYRNLILNAAYMYKTKGTRQSLDYVMRFIGAPEALLEFNEIVYVADAKINIDKFNEQYAQISGGTKFVTNAELDGTNTFKIQGIEYTGYTSSGLLKLVNTTLNDYGIDNDGYPKSPQQTDTNFFQKGAGWFEKSPKHRSVETVDAKNSQFTGSNPYLVTEIAPFNFGQEYMNSLRKFEDMDVGYTLRRVSDNQKSWAVNDVGTRKIDSNFNGVDYNVSNDKLVINSKNLELYMNMGQGITYDVWDMSVKYDYPIPNSGLTAPYPYPGNIDWTHIDPKPKQKTFFEFAQSFYNNFINVRNRQTISDGKTGGYPTLQSVFWNYLQSEQTVGIPNNNFTYQKMIDYTLGIGDYWQRLLEQMVPGTTLWLTGQKMENSVFHRQKYVYRRQRGCQIIPVACIPCKYMGQPFAYDCIDQTLTCSIQGSPSEMIQSLLASLLTQSGFTQNMCDLNSIVSNWYVDCRLDSQILVQELFYTGYGINDYPTQTQLINALDTELAGLYNYGLNYYFSGNNLIVSNSSCYDNFSASTLYLNIGIDIDINCTPPQTTPTPTPTPTPVVPTPTPTPVYSEVNFYFGAPVASPSNVSFVYRVDGGAWTYINGQTVGNKPSTLQNYQPYGTSMVVGSVVDFGILNSTFNNITFGNGNNSGIYTGYCGISSYNTHTVVSGSNLIYINIQNTGGGYVIC